jgi:hypothetical protein
MMTFDQMKSYVDKCMEAYGNSLREICLTGGECMLLKDDAFKILEYANSLGLICNIVTNGFWATSYKTAYNTLQRLKNVGLKSVTLSTGDDHAEWIPVKRVRDAAVAATRLHIVTIIRIEQQYMHAKAQEELLNDATILSLMKEQRINIELIKWVDYSNEEKVGNNIKNRDIVIPKRFGCTSMFQSITITPYGDVLACCGLSCTRIPQLRLGNINVEPIKDIYERAFEDHLKVWIRTEGPHNILKFVHDNTNWRFNCSYSNCAVCMEIFKSERILNFLKEHYYEWAGQLVRSYYPITYDNIKR